MKNMIWPSKLQPGDSVALIAPSSRSEAEKTEIAAESLRYLGLSPKIYPSCFCSHGYFSGDDARRAADLNAAFADHEVKGIFCLRGGYGATRLLKLLDYETIAANPKVFCGYSDITALHTVFNRLCGFITFHAPMPNTDYTTMDEFSLHSLKDAVFGNPSKRVLLPPPGTSMTSLCGGSACGKLVGGNLSLLTATLGSPYEIDTRDSILFIEETEEELYKVDRALTALALAGKFKHCNAILLGTFSDCTAADPAPSLTLPQIFREILLPFRKPIVADFPCGHSYPQHTLSMGASMAIDADNLQLRFLQ